jgi:hypothetical protein
MRRNKLRPFCLAIVLLCGCQPAQTYVVSSTVLGLHAAVNTSANSGKLQFGYDRAFATIIPRSVPVSDTGQPGGKKEVMSVLGCSDVKVDGIVLSQFQEVLSTGEAAKTYADAMKNIPSTQHWVYQCLTK